MDKHAINLTALILSQPLKGRGRPKVKKTFSEPAKNSLLRNKKSNLACLHCEEKITTDQFNAGENFLWILHKVRQNVPIPRLAKSGYQERIEGIFWEWDFRNAENQKEIFEWWHASIQTLKKAGETTKNLVENFIWNNDPPHMLSVEELQMIKRGLNRLAELYSHPHVDLNEYQRRWRPRIRGHCEPRSGEAIQKSL